ncbi:hypothetical protein PHABIO_214 [Pseudomonas phage Phabio]|uniref:Uncharacterized protein n=1 Tax=Pseudomonas phage Phabio TaxID=2006668 RepID=A0A1Y0SWI2_9CAUD|nr:hypothetical protein MZD05_gp214 [Pseudomonas phage Phabio]ARV76845.1 hypothetical protein PHABIO_214 [Pseudomonas phage Phabio]
MMMADAWFVQTGNVINCNKQIKKIFEWNSQHLENRHDTGRHSN